MHEVVNNMWRWEIKEGLRGKIKGTKAKEGKKVKERNKGCRMCSGATQNIEGENKK